MGGIQAWSLTTHAFIICHIVASLTDRRESKQQESKKWAVFSTIYQEASVDPTGRENWGGIQFGSWIALSPRV